MLTYKVHGLGLMKTVYLKLTCHILSKKTIVDSRELNDICFKSNKNSLKTFLPGRLPSKQYPRFKQIIMISHRFIRRLCNKHNLNINL